MSFTVTIDVRCDTCTDWIDGTRGQLTTKREAREAAKRAGWKYSEGRDICPQCSCDYEHIRARYCSKCGWFRGATQGSKD